MLDTLRATVSEPTLEASGTKRDVVTDAALVAAAAVLAVFTTRAVLRATGGEPAAPLDDTFIHFQYARSFANLEPFVYTPGATPSAGATSLLWPLVLAPFVAVGIDEVGLVWPAWVLGWAALGGLAVETRRLACGLLAPGVAAAAGAMVVAFGGFAWFAASGMEVVPFAWLLVRTTRRSVEWLEGRFGPRSRGSLAELVLLAVAAPAMRPEGVLVSALAATALALGSRGYVRAWALVAATAPGLPAAVYAAFTGHPSSTTALVKWLPASPYYGGSTLAWAILDNVGTLFATLLDGRVWSALFLPAGCGPVAWAAPLALVAVGVLAERRWRAFFVLALALGMLLPTTYDSFLWNRLRYLWPFAPAWFIGVAALAQLVGRAAHRLRGELEPVRLLVAGGFAGALAGHLGYAIDDVATSADAVRRQHVALGRWLRHHVPEDAVIGVNDTGAIAYLSGRRVFDVVGLTTAGEGRYWVAGAGSRFEHYERMGSASLPTHFAVYPEWLRVPSLLGDWLTERSVPGATILGGTTKAVHVAAYDALGSGALPAQVPGAPVDVLDVADLESEAEHGYELGPGTMWLNVAVSHGHRTDGGRQSRTRDRFDLVLSPGGVLVARLGAERETSVEVLADGHLLATWDLSATEWQERTATVPHDGVRRRRSLVVRPTGSGAFASLHYWSFE